MVDKAVPLSQQSKADGSSLNSSHYRDAWNERTYELTKRTNGRINETEEQTNERNIERKNEQVASAIGKLDRRAIGAGRDHDHINLVEKVSFGGPRL